MFPSSYTVQYFRCPKIENARALIQNEIVDSPQLIIIHTRTNDLEMTHTVDDLISEITTMITEASTKFPCFQTLLTLTNKFAFNAQSYQMCTWSLITTYLQKAQMSYMTINIYGDVTLVCLRLI